MSRGSKITIVSLIIFFSVSISAKWYKYIVVQDYHFYATIDCDPDAESCFVADCDPSTDEECDNEWTYKYIEKNASRVAECNPYEPHNEVCEELACEDNEEDCEITECSVDNLSEGEICYSKEISGATQKSIDYE